MKLFFSGPSERVHSPVRSDPRGLPGRTKETVSLQGSQRAVEPAWVVATETERFETLEQVVSMRGLLEQKQQQARAEKVPGQCGISGRAGPAPRGSAPL